MKALLEPVDVLKNKSKGNYTKRLILTEEYKAFPFGAVYNYFCLKEGVPVSENWLDLVLEYEKKVIVNRL